MAPEASPKDAAFLVSVIKHMTSNPTVNWEAVTAEMGLKNVKSTRTRYGQIKSKLEAQAVRAPGSDSLTTGADDDNGGASETKSPTKRKCVANKKETPRKAAKKIPGAVKEEPEENDEDQNEEV